MQQNIYYILIFSVIGLIIYYCIPQKIRSHILFLECLIFYAICDYKFLLLLIIEVFISWLLALKIDKKRLCVGIFFTILILFIFKYFNFFINCFNISFNKILLPLGISYYSFKIISYLYDVYSNKRNSEPSFITYSVYVLFFPQLICGPITRSNSITEQIKKGLTFNKKMFCNEITRIIEGLFMKTVIADRCSYYVNIVFDNPDNFPSLALILALLLYSVQLYCDFSGYSLIAQGLTNCYGFDCINNFQRPYLAINIRDFWKRWHISLSSWLRDYVYIPLGGNRCSTIRKWCNVLITFVICGIWHGSSFHYFIWGAYHGILNNLTPKNRNYGKITKIFIRIVTIFLVILGWLIFRTNSIESVIKYIKRIISCFSVSYQSITETILPFTGDNTAIAYILTLFLMILLLIIKEIIEEKEEKPLSLIWTLLFIILTVFLGITGTSNFLYANF